MAPILFEDRHLAIVDKPAGLPVIPPREGGANLAGLTGFRVCHRLDTETSGVLVMAKTAAGQRLVSAAFLERRVEKAYLAVCTGLLADAGTAEQPLGDWKRGRVQVGRGREALTRWTVRARCGDRLLVEAHPVTGRTHQVRAHLAASGAPIAGDEAYGGIAAEGIALHAWWIVLPWPRQSDRLRVQAAPPPSFARQWPGELP